MLADFYNVQAEVPTFADDYTANKAKYATTPAAVRGFEHLQQGFEAGWWNEDFGAASYDDGLRMVASGEAAHYPMLTFAIGAIQQNFPDELNDVGFFAQPGPGRLEERADRLDAGGALHLGGQREHRAGQGLPGFRRLASRAARS